MRERTACAQMVQRVQKRALRRPFDEQRAGRQSVSDKTIAKMEQEMKKDRRVTVRKLCDRISDVSKTAIDKIVTEHLG